MTEQTSLRGDWIRYSYTSTVLFRLSNIFCSRSFSYRVKFISKIGESAFQYTEIKISRKMKILCILNFVIPYLASKITLKLISLLLSLAQ